MAVRTSAYLKAKFETGDTPAQADFVDLIDTLFGTSGKTLATPVAGNTLGNLTTSMEVFDAAGVSLGFIPIYDAITQGD
jgi:hypothetical protein